MSYHISTIPPHAPFIETLASYILDQYGYDPMALTEVTILLPTQRACRALKEAFLKQTEGKALLLPKIEAMGEVEEEEALFAFAAQGRVIDLPNVVSSTEQRLLLTQLVGAWQKAAPTGDKRMTLAQSAHLAVELSSFLAEIQRQKLSLDNLEQLVPEELATHWQITLQFLRILIDTWPLLLQEKEKVDPAHYRNLAIAMQCEYWKQKNWDKPVIAAGSTGSLPAVRELLGTVAGLSKGQVILPGLDTIMVNDAWENLTPSHAQYGLKQLLDYFQVPRFEVAVLGHKNTVLAQRTELVSLSMLPANYTHAWQNIKTISHDALEGLQYITTTSLQEEAEVIALHLRRVLETAGKTAALITHERVLARKTATILARWGIAIDDSAGVVLNATSPAVFLRLLIKVMESNVSTPALLSLLKHPLAAAGMEPVVFRHLIYFLEKFGLRGVSIAPGFAAIKRIAANLKRDELIAALDKVEHILAPFIQLRKKNEISLQLLLTTHLKTAFALAASDKEEGKQRLLGNDMGQQLEVHLNDMIGASAHFQTMAASDYMGLFDSLLAGKVYRPRFGKHPRLAILSPLEARMLPFDFIILGGLNEGTWPALPEIDPWMSRAMRSKFGLPQPERQIGLAAHDFAQMLGNKEVLITRSEKVKGAQTLASRWVQTLETLLTRMNLVEHFRAANPWQAWLTQLHHVTYVGPVAPPAPTPPLAVRPQKLAATAIERWLRDPYSLYASTILNLRKLKPLDYLPSMAEFGTMVHGVFDEYIKIYPTLASSEDVHFEFLLEKGQIRLNEFMLHPITYNYWLERFKKIAKWFIAQEAQKRQKGIEINSEQWGETEIVDGFILGAKADRIEKDGTTIAIVDYKTGTLPSLKDIELGYSSQMILEGLIANQGGFKEIGIDKGCTLQLEYWKMSGGSSEVVTEMTIGQGKKAIDVLIQEAYEGLTNLIKTFNNPQVPYLSVPNPDKAPMYNDYTHLARVKEWES